jgi:cathepsin B
MKLLLLALLVGVAFAAVSKELADKLNMKQSLWTASHEGRIQEMDMHHFKHLLGFDRRSWMAKHQNIQHVHHTEEEIAAVPDSFDSRTNWPNCASMKAVRDQSDCGSCWAFGAVEAMSDRECVYNNRDHSYSAEQMNSCSGECGSCDGGDPGCAWDYWQSTGLVEEVCRPYSLPGCDHHIANSSNPCPSNEYPTPACVKKCLSNSSLTWAKDVHKSTSSYTASGEADIMAEIYQNGPCETAFDVYSDFEAYTGGIYQNQGGDYLGGHAVKFVGWGVEGGVKYWIVANSWNVHWGEQGFFRIIKGQDECGIEDTVWCGAPAKP